MNRTHFPNAATLNAAVDRIDDAYASPALIEEACPSLPPDYRVEHAEEGPNHEWGKGGKFERDTRVYRDGALILASRDELAYMTYGDDSEDHPTWHTCATWLVSDDPLGRQIMSRLRAKAATAVRKPR
jgi:hypothetical protein